MKKLILTLSMGTICMFCLSIGGYSQVQIKVGPEAGFGWSTLTSKYAGERTTYIGVNGQFGVGAEIKLADMFALRPSLMFNSKACLNTDDLFDNGNTTITLNTITLPVTAVLRKEFRNSSNFFVGFGPTIGYTISGKVKDDSGSESLKFGSDKDLKPFELGINGKLGFQFKNNLYLQFYGNAGLNNRSTTNGGVFKAHDVWGFGIGYLFGGK